jgi:hypothetical protein
VSLPPASAPRARAHFPRDHSRYRLWALDCGRAPHHRSARDICSHFTRLRRQSPSRTRHLSHYSALGSCLVCGVMLSMTVPFRHPRSHRFTPHLTSVTGFATHQ